MRWKVEIRPEPGNTRTRIKFRLWPTRALDGYIYWLESIAVKEVYDYFHGWIADEYLGQDCPAYKIHMKLKEKR